MSRPPRICLDLTPLEMWDRHGGIGRYCVHLLEELLALPGEARGAGELYAMPWSTRPPLPGAAALEAIQRLEPEVPMETHWRQRRKEMGNLVRRAGMDLFHSAVPGVPVVRPGCRTVATVYDLIPLVMPNYRGAAFKKWNSLRKATRKFRNTYGATDHVISISERTRRDLVEKLGMQQDRISVVHLGVDGAQFSSTPASPEEGARLRAEHGLPDRYFVCVGSDHYRKNHRRLFDAWCAMAGGIEEGLVFVGRPLYAETLGEIQESVKRRGLEKRFTWLRDLGDDVLPGIYRHATAAVAPSLYEGFGMTLLEAMACGAPVVAARNGAYEEVAGDDALYFDPRSERSIAEALTAMARDAPLRASLTQRGLDRARDASWSRMARETHSIYQQLLAGSGVRAGFSELVGRLRG